VAWTCPNCREGGERLSGKKVHVGFIPGLHLGVRQGVASAGAPVLAYQRAGIRLQLAVLRQTANADQPNQIVVNTTSLETALSS